MKKTLLGAAAAIGVAAVAFSGSANAACYWNGYNWNCASPQVYYQPYPYSVRLPAVLWVFPARLLRVLLVLESVALPGSPGQRPRRLLIASERAARRRWRLSEDGMT
jgi:hypothetical protein